jgi:hypothetical protein
MLINVFYKNIFQNKEKKVMNNLEIYHNDYLKKIREKNEFIKNSQKTTNPKIGVSDLHVEAPSDDIMFFPKNHEIK